MVIFLTILITMVYLAGLIKGTLFAGTINKMKKLAKDFLDLTPQRRVIEMHDYQKAMLVQGVIIAIGSLFWFVIEMILLINFLGHEYLRYPAALMVVAAFLKMFSTSKNDKDMFAEGSMSKVVDGAKNVLEIKTRKATMMIFRAFGFGFYMLSLLILLEVVS
ncbi:hypothetical protein [Microcystis phage MaeS]|nr:hypothetical protein [Microcystis phage MaeS]